MPEDRSLDEFVVGESGDEERDDGAEDDDGSDANDADEPADGGEAQTADGEETERVDADPATPTATWTTDGADCDRCGEPISRRWSDDGALVCAACKEW